MRIDGKTILVIGLIVLGLLYLRSLSQSTGQALSARAPGRYTNTETWDITWDHREALPTRIVIHRDARLS